MSSRKVGSFILGAVCVAVFGAIPTPADAQTGSTFVLLLDRSGPPVYEIVTDPLGNPILDPVTGQPLVQQVGGAFVNPCTGENVDLIGSTTITIIDGLDKAGNRRINVTELAKANGTGWIVDPIDLVSQLFTGNLYRFRELQTFFVKAPQSSFTQAFESEFTDKFVMRGLQGLDDWVIRARFRLKILADGTVKVNLVKMTQGDGCRNR